MTGHVVAPAACCPSMSERASVTLWSLEWGDGRLTVLSATDLDSAENLARQRLAGGVEGWPSNETAQIHAIRPVGFLELNVASWWEHNAPCFGRIRIDGEIFSWGGPHRIAPSPRAAKPPGARAPQVASAAGVPCRLWSYVGTHDRLVLFTAPDRKSAAALSVELIECGNSPETHLEQVEDIELHLAPDARGLAPTCYRVWIEGRIVGWPIPRLDPPRRDGPPDGPLGAEARLAIPTYHRTRDPCPAERSARLSAIVRG